MAHIENYQVNVWIGYIPITFLLGFFVNYIVNRWSDQLANVAFPDRFLIFITANFEGFQAIDSEASFTSS